MSKLSILEWAFGLSAVLLGFALFMCMRRARHDQAQQARRPHVAHPRMTVEQCRWVERFQSHVVPCPACGHRALPVPGEADRYSCGGCAHVFTGTCHNLPPCPDHSTSIA